MQVSQTCHSGGLELVGGRAGLGTNSCMTGMWDYSKNWPFPGWEDISRAVAGAQGCRAEERISYDSLGSSTLPPTAWDHNNLLSLTQFARLLYKM